MLAISDYLNVMRRGWGGGRAGGRTRAAEKGEGGSAEITFFAYYRGVEVENSSGRVVKEEKRWACRVGEEVKNGSLQLSEWVLSN